MLLPASTADKSNLLPKYILVYTDKIFDTALILLLIGELPVIFETILLYEVPIIVPSSLTEKSTPTVPPPDLPL